MGRREGVAISVALVATTALWLWLRPLAHPIIDDAAIVLRYLDNFRAGHFYSYNVEDGPVFGVSGFVHGILSGGLAWLQLRPELCLMFSNALGSLLFFFFLTRISLRLYSPIGAVAAVGFFLVASEFVPRTFFLGLETPLHLGIVLWMLDAYASRSPALPLACAICIVSKLDAVPLVACTLIAAVWRAHQEQARPNGVRRELLQILLGFALPMLAWVAFATLEFGSPLPQTFIAKHFVAEKPHDSWFPFLIPLLRTPAQLGSALIACAVALLVLIIGMRRRSLVSVPVVVATGALVTLGQYAWFNPVERMAWYYTLPEVLFLLAIVMLPSLLRSRGALAAAIAAALVVMGLRAGLAAESVRGLWIYNDRIETERIEIGRTLEALVPVGEKLIAGHGHVARESHRYVIDYSGLNSRIVTARHRDLGRLVDELAPKALAMHGLPSTEFQLKHGLHVAHTYYNVTIEGFPAMRIYTIGGADRTITEPLPQSKTPSERVVLKLDGSPAIRAVSFGVAQARAAQLLEMRADGLKQTCEIPPERPACRGGCTAECTLRVPPGTPVSQLSIESALPFVALEPTLTRSVP